MSYFEEIKGLFINEIMNSPQYQLGLKIKDLIKQEIITPNINFSFIYQLQNTDYIDINNKEHEETILKMALKVILGFEVEISYSSVIVIMDKFLQ
jgi:hypothetical protein